MKTFKIPKGSLISKKKADDLIRTATEHVQVADNGHAVHYIKKDGVIFIVGEMSMAEAKQKRAKLVASRHRPDLLQ